jgi:hypothetical protein
VGEALVEGGRAAYLIGDFNLAAQLLETAVSYYGFRQHHAAMARWMLGVACWSIPERHEAGLAAWQRSIETVQMMAEGRTVSRVQAEWYQRALIQMRATMLATLKEDKLPFEIPQPAPQEQAYTEATGQEQPPNTPPQGGVSGVGKKEISLLRICPQFDRLSTAFVEAKGARSTSPGYMEAESLILGGRQYHIFSLVGEKIIDLTEAPGIGNHIVIRAQDDSLDQEGIDDGDYVLVRVQNKAGKKDLIAVEILGKGGEVVLRKLNKRGKEIILSPRSSNPLHKERRFNKNSQDFRIRGVVLAVFKQN